MIFMHKNQQNPLPASCQEENRIKGQKNNGKNQGEYETAQVSILSWKPYLILIENGCQPLLKNVVESHFDSYFKRANKTTSLKIGRN